MLGIISDVHGNYPALKAVMGKLDEYGCREIISLGDIAGYYCMINECIELCEERNVVNIMGNHDYYLVNGVACARSRSANICLEYQGSIITDENIGWLKRSIEKIETETLSMRHGGWNDSLDEYISDFSFSVCEGKGQTIYASGHTHCQCKKQHGGIIYFNPGSVGQPRDGDPRAAFAVIDRGEVLLERAEYDIDEVYRRMKRLNFDDRISTCLYRGSKIGGI